MARIAVLGASGYAGAAVVAEARRRGHDVTAVSRTAPTSPVDGVTYVEGSVLDADVLDRVIADADVVVSALSPRDDMAGKVEGVVEDLIGRLAGTTTRLGYVGGASSRPETSTLIGQPSSTVMIGMTFLPFEFLLLAPATGLQPPIRRRQGVLQRAFQDGRKALSAGVRVLWLTEGDGTDGDDDDGRGPASRHARGCMAEAQRR